MPFTLIQSIHQGCPLSPILYVLRWNPIIRSLMLPGSTEVTRYTAYADDVSVLVTSSAGVVEVSKEIGGYEIVTGVKINREKSVDWIHGGTSFGRVGRARYSAPGSVSILNWRKIGQKYMLSGYVGSFP